MLVGEMRRHDATNLKSTSDLRLDTPGGAEPRLVVDGFLKKRPQSLLRKRLTFAYKVFGLYNNFLVRWIAETDQITSISWPLDRAVSS